MTGEEALDKLNDLCEVDVPEECYKPCIEIISKDLKVLEILKKHLVVETEDDERKELGESVNCYLKSWLSSDKEDYQKVKEWLENKYAIYIDLGR